MIKQFLSAIFILTTSISIAQEKYTASKFGDIKKEDFIVKATANDSSQGAIILFDKGICEFEGGNKSQFRLVFTRHKRVKILNKNANALSTVSIPLYFINNGNKEEVFEAKATTYNLENNSIEKEKLKSKDFIFSSIDKNHNNYKFAFTNVKDGCIIEYEYVLKSDFIRTLRDWQFQTSYRTLLSEYEVAIPQGFNYVFLVYGDQNYDTMMTKVEPVNYHFSNMGTLPERGTGYVESHLPNQFGTMNTNVRKTKWIMYNTPQIIEEPFTTSIWNHISRISFQLKSIEQDGIRNDIVLNWEQFCTEQLKHERFGEQLHKNYGWMKDVLKNVVKDNQTQYQKAKAVFNYIRDNFTVDDYNVYLTRNATLKDIFQKKSGNVADINLLLISFLYNQKIDAKPVILSTRANGVVNPTYPLLDEYNYVICKTNIDGEDYFLDATNKKMAFGNLPLHCYNGNARLISDSNKAIIFDPNTVIESSESQLNFTFVDNKLKGKMVSSHGNYSSLSIRNNYTSEKEFISAFLKNQSSNKSILIKDVIVDSFDNYEQPITVNYDIEIANDNNDIIYLDPFIEQGFSENPFKSAERNYPVEMPYLLSDKSTVNIQLPSNYIIDDIPKSMRIFLNQKDAMFSYIVKNNGTTIEITTELQFFTTIFEPELYEEIRNFFATIIKKTKQQIVLKKK